ncbi:hypothetical protein EDB19DRAFT_1732562 [Suillus lakei]|nr:hypothetical protein EDB19DRAFT_1732562 [Suillus lakei]
MTPLSVLGVWNAVFMFSIPSPIVCIYLTSDYGKRIPKRYTPFTLSNLGHYIISIANQPTTDLGLTSCYSIPLIQVTSYPTNPWHKYYPSENHTHHAERRAKLSLFVSLSYAILHMASLNPCFSLHGLYICPRGSASSDLFGHR